MQAVHQLPQMMGHHYLHHTLNGITSNPGPSALATPPATRKRKRAHQYTVNYSEVQEVDSDGKLREVIVIEDSPPPMTMSPATTRTGAFSASYQPPVFSAPIRTRARAAAEAQALSSSSASVILAPVVKKRKRDHFEEVRAPNTKRAALNGHQAQLPAQTKSWDSRSAAATDDVRIALIMKLFHDYVLIHCHVQTSKGPAPCDDKEGHYIIVSDDIIHGRCKSCFYNHVATQYNRSIDRTVRLLGQGTFGKVVEAVDTQSNTRVAIKIIRAIPKYRDASKIEVRVLQKLKEHDPYNKKFVFKRVLYSDSLLIGIFEVNVFIYWNGSTIETIYVLSQSFWGCACTTSSKRTNLCHSLDITYKILPNSY